MDNREWMIFLGFSVAFLYAVAIFLIWQIWRLKKNREFIPSKHLLLLGADLSPVWEMELQDERGIVIGKSGQGITPDFDLTCGENKGDIAPHHAVLNPVKGHWYLEALENRYQVGIRRAGESVVYRLKPWTPYLVESGDQIYIAGERLLFQ